jgi:hypothetical protein
MTETEKHRIAFNIASQIQCLLSMTNDIDIQEKLLKATFKVIEGFNIQKSIPQANLKKTYSFQEEVKKLIKSIDNIVIACNQDYYNNNQKELLTDHEYDRLTEANMLLNSVIDVKTDKGYYSFLGIKN